MTGDLFLASASPAPKLRVGLLIDGPELPAVFAAMVDDIQRSSFAEIVLVVRNAGGAGAAPRPASLAARALKFLRTPELRHAIAYALYLRLDEKRSRRAGEDPTRRVDCSERLRGIPQLAVAPLVSGHVQRFPPEALDAIRAVKLDVFVRFGFNILKGDILTAARYGIWSFHHGDNDFYRGSPPYFWEMTEDNPRAGVILQVLSEKLDDGLVLAKGQYANEGGVSLYLTRMGPYWGSAYFLIWKLKQLHEQGFEALKAQAVPPAPYAGRQKLYKKPKNRDVLGWLARAVRDKLAERLGRRIQHWQTAVRRDVDMPSVRPGTGALDLSRFAFFAAPKGHFYADPMLFVHEGRTYLFLEDYDYAADRGDIAVMDITDGVPQTADICLATGSHLSYPLVFAHDGALYMIPESMAAGEVALYRAELFPHRWVKEKVLFRGPVVDTTPYLKDGVWYFFATFLAPGTKATSLHLFTADSLTGEWRLHPASPLSNDVRDARCAGRIVEQDGVLYRPAQDCSGTYGRAIRFCRIDRLTPDDYAETPVLEVGPDAVPAFAGQPCEGIHTYDRAGRFEVIDAKYSLPRTEIL
ncbi:hypothetical protein [Aquabacter cavernae]|uniref:glucosamine inositolphosphorylceramide transferase family protein n=1 Tax=Aquabacter cavernae TaxID=2496029 RepID=UPI000F8ED70A|nr:hypothetical protein [Aquabacter cavernae]